MPLSDSIENAWLVSKILPMVPSTGATILLPVGLMAIPSPTIFSAKTTSGTSSMLTISPERGATISIVPVSFLSSETRDFNLSNKPMIFS
ncbi:hypothetical protein UUU_30580 [Klebsiella pneumoniae subsp. pneumoniae DSM 30104 = JCM 1662 = NBRC 14940]|nr:hypothetical protein UUU_30580 [Klebsiella pneumoniae subsp. pneumoniae DSM 30104 = JCM 1662 = NBRC 14940]